jgi:hypothetical protein
MRRVSAPSNMALVIALEMSTNAQSDQVFRSCFLLMLFTRAFCSGLFAQVYLLRREDKAGISI